MTAQKKVMNIFYPGPIGASFIAKQIEKHHTKTNIGAHQIFLGQIRADLIKGKTVTAIEYTTYEEMTREKMDEIRKAIFEKYPLICLHIYHSLGRVNVGEICLFEFISATHRRAAIDGCAEIVERIKAELPIWGKEIFEDTEYRWKVNQ